MLSSFLREAKQLEKPTIKLFKRTKMFAIAIVFNLNKLDTTSYVSQNVAIFPLFPLDILDHSNMWKNFTFKK